MLYNTLVIIIFVIFLLCGITVNQDHLVILCLAFTFNYNNKNKNNNKNKIDNKINLTYEYNSECKKGSNTSTYNARPHVSKVTLQKLNKFGFKTLHHPHYSPDLELIDLYFFKHLSNFLLKKCFINQGDAETAFNEFVESITPDSYVARINKLVFRWQKCLYSNGFYFN